MTMSGISLGEKFRHCRFIREIELRTIASYEISNAFGLESAGERATHHPPMTGYEDFVEFVHSRWAGRMLASSKPRWLCHSD